VRAKEALSIPPEIICVRWQANAFLTVRPMQLWFSL